MHLVAARVESSKDVRLADRTSALTTSGGEAQRTEIIALEGKLGGRACWVYPLAAFTGVWEGAI